jgi:hypothetical protein
VFEEGGKLSKSLFLAYFVSSLCFSLPALAEDDVTSEYFNSRYSNQAVDGINLKISAQHNSVYFNDAEFIEFDFFPGDDILVARLDLPQESNGKSVNGSLTIPVADSYGIQLDGYYIPGNIKTFGLGGRFFYRDSDTGLLGLYGQVRESSGEADIDNYQVAVEAELYKDQYTLELFAGYETAKFGETIVVPGGSEGFFTGEAIVGFYPDPNFKISAGITHYFDTTSFKAGMEWQLTETKLAPSIFVDGQYNGDVSWLTAGISFNFNNTPRTLIDNHRNGSLKSRLIDSIPAFASCARNIIISDLSRPQFGPLDAGIPIPPFADKLDGCSSVRAN